jgi:ElaB/YqjD/DUF883 family membrane-anchored ribosome-binding protein
MVDDSGGKAGARHPPDAQVLAAIATLREDVKRLTDDLALYAENQRAPAGSALAGALDSARSQISQTALGIDGFAADVEADMRARIRSKPITSVLIAAAVGYAWRSLRRRR